MKDIAVDLGQLGSVEGIESRIESTAKLLHPAIHFLANLESQAEATFHITAFTDLPRGAEKPKPDPLLREFDGLTIAQVEDRIPELKRLNDAGAGIFFCVNQCYGKRKKENVTRVRCVHADFDSATQLQIEVVRQKLTPSIEVRTSGTNKCHLYWLLDEADELDVPTAEAINRSLVDFGADSAATDASRLLRLPGFKHMKYRGIGETPLVTATYSREKPVGGEQ
jgi:hypothetical protein